MGRFYLYVTCFLMGFTILGLELLGFRFYGPVYGYSTYVYGTLIGVILAAMSVGYAIGGRLADRAPRPAVLYKVLAAAGLLLVGFCFVYHPVLEWFWRAIESQILSMILVTVLLYGPIMVLLSITSPFIIRLIALRDKVGTAAGSIFAVSTVGSILGSFITPFVLVPHPAIGAHMTLVVMTCIVVVVAVLGLIASRGQWALALLALGLLPLSFPGKAEGVVFHIQSPYSDLAVRHDEKTDTYLLAVNEWAYYSKGLAEGQTRTGSYYDYFLLGPALVPVREMAVLGVAAGTSIKEFQRVYPDVHIDAVDIDPWVIKIAQDPRWFNLQESEQLDIHVEDARPFMRRTEKKYDLVEIDMYQGGPFIPFYVTTVEFFESLKAHMSDDGLAITNVLALAHDELLVACVVETIQEVFGDSVYVVHHSSNTLVFAFKKPTLLHEVRRRIEAQYTGPLSDLAHEAIAITTPDPYPGAHVFRDDDADVARISYKMLQRTVRQRRQRLEQERVGQ